VRLAWLFLSIKRNYAIQQIVCQMTPATSTVNHPSDLTQDHGSLIGVGACSPLLERAGRLGDSPRCGPIGHVHRIGPIPRLQKQQKTDVAEHPQVFDHVGLLINGLPGTAGSLFA